MSKTFLDSMNNVEALRPSATEFSYAQRSKWAYDVALRLYHDFGVTKQADYLLSTILKTVDLTAISTQVQIANVQHLFVTCTQTTASTNVTSTQSWDEYALEQYMDPVNPNNVLWGSYFPDERIVRVQYLAYPAIFPTTSSDSTTIIDIDQEAFNAVEYGTLSRICKSGDAPDVQLANAYEQDFQEEVRRLKAMVRNRTRKLANDKVSYREWEWK
jgi:hypothetical protein